MKTIEIIKINSKKYPNKLRKIKNPPKQLYLKGNADLLKTNGIAVIGSKECSKKAELIAEQFTRELVKHNITIISGMENRN